MGPAQSTVINKTNKKLCVMTFNNADLLYNSYNTMYIIEPGESKVVESASDPIGLKIAIVYDAAPDGQVLFYQRWQVKNKTTLTVTYCNGSDISTFGDDTTLMGKGQLTEGDATRFANAIEALTYQAPITRAAQRK